MSIAVRWVRKDFDEPWNPRWFVFTAVCGQRGCATVLATTDGHPAAAELTPGMIPNERTGRYEMSDRVRRQWLRARHGFHREAKAAEGAGDPETARRLRQGASWNSQNPQPRHTRRPEGKTELSYVATQSRARVPSVATRLPVEAKCPSCGFVNRIEPLGGAANLD